MRTASLLAALLGAAVSSARAAPAHRFLWDFSGGGVYTDNVFRDSSARSDVGLEGSLGLGLRSRYGRATTSRLAYQLRTLRFRKYDAENRTGHDLFAEAEHRLTESLRLGLRGAAGFRQLPEVDVFDYRDLRAQPFARWHVTDRTSLEGGVTAEKRAFPDHDLDYEGRGAFGRLGREFSLRTYAELFGSWMRKDYSERHLFGQAGSSRINLDPLREDEESVFGARLSLSPTLSSRLGLEYRYERLLSNGNFFDFGPKQTVDDNSTAGDERVVDGYYGYRAHQVSLQGRHVVELGSYVVFSAGYERRRYDGRLAKDDGDAIRSPEEKRHDDLVSFSVFWEKRVELKESGPVHPGLRLGYSHERNISNDSLYNYSANRFSAAVTLWF